MSSVNPTTSAHSDTLLVSGQSGENGGGSTGQKNVLVKKVSPFDSGDATTTVFSVGSSTTLEDLKTATRLATPVSEERSPTAPIQSVIDLLFTSDFMKEINEGFMDGLKDKDKSFMSIDVVKNPKNYTALQKLIAYLDLLQTKATFEKYKDSLDDNQRGINNDQEIFSDLENAISILGSDPEVNSLLTEKVFKGFKLIFSGYRVAPADTNKDPWDIINDTITRADKAADLRQKVEEAFLRDIVNGGLLDEGLKAGKSIDTIVTEYNTALGFYSMVLPDEFVNQNTAAADKVYAEFFDKNVLPTISSPSTAMEGLIRMGFAGDKTEQELKGLGSALPVVDFEELLGRGGDLFPDLNIDLDGLKRVAAGEFGSTVANNITHLFNPAIQTMANQFYGGTDDAAARERFKADVKGLVGEVLEKVASGDVIPSNLGGYLERVTRSLTNSGGKEINGYRHAVQTALEGLVMGASLVSKMPPNAEWNTNSSPLPASNLASYSFNAVMAMIMIATGLAGKGIAATGGGSGRFFIGSGGDAWIAERMFGTRDNGWSNAIMSLDLPYIDREFLTSSIKGMGLVMSDLMKTLMPGINVIDPIVLDDKTAEEALRRIITPSLDALAETLFKGDAEAMAQYKTNFTTIFTALWATIRPGGSIETIKSDLAKLIDKTVTSAPAGVDAFKYKAALSSGVMSVLNASRAIYADLNMTVASWDNVGIVVLHSLGAIVHMSNAIGSAIKASNLSMLDGIGFLGGFADDFARAQRSVLSAFFKNGATVLGAAVGIGWLPVEYYQLLSLFKSGKGDPVDLAFLTIGAVADTIGAIEGVVGIANMLVNSTFLGRTGASVALLSSGFSLSFAIAGAISWAAWSGLAIYQSIKQEKAFHKQTDMMNDMLKRTVNDTVSIYAKTGPIIGGKGGGFQTRGRGEPEQKVLTPENWDIIIANVEQQRKTTAA